MNLLIKTFKERLQIMLLVSRLYWTIWWKSEGVRGEHSDISFNICIPAKGGFLLYYTPIPPFFPHHIWVGSMYLTNAGRHIVILCLSWLTAFIRKLGFSLLKENTYRNVIFMISHCSTLVIPFEIVRRITTGIPKLLP